MFTIEQIKAAHAKVKSGSDFPSYIQEIISLGVINYCNNVNNGNTIYNGKNNYSVTSGAKYSELIIAEKSNAEVFKNYLKLHQQGKSDYLTFCKQSAETGVEKWVCDLEKMTCSYFDKNGTVLLVEQIPSV